MPKIVYLSGMEILDSRGRPTVKATCEIEGGAVGYASVPSGASTGAAEALELRDDDPGRYGGLGCQQAAANVGGTIRGAIVDRSFDSQSELDRAMIELDGTENKSRLGANTILAVSLAFARAWAAERDVPLYRHFADLLERTPVTLPRPTINLFSGGKHAGGQIPIQDTLVAPMSARTMDEALATTYDVYQSAAKIARDRYGMRALTADEGGLAPPFPDAEAMLENAVEAIELAGLEPGRDMALAVDVAASHFYDDSRYYLGDAQLDGAGMIEHVVHWIDRHPIISVEDGLSENDWESWPKLCKRLAKQALVLGDDLLCTNPERIRRAVESRAANALLLKVNQIGTLTEAAETLKLARDAGWAVTVSAITQSERLAKYNRLLEIEVETGLRLANFSMQPQSAS
jgi:enolase